MSVTVDDVLSLLDEMNEQGRIEYADYSQLHDAIAATLGEQHSTAEIDELLDEFEHECYMLRVEASETRAKDEDVRKAYGRIREESARAIAATLSGVGSEVGSEVTSEVRGGKLTAEQVHDAIFNGSSYASFDGAKYYADGIGMQAIADELNAEMGGGECDAVRNERTQTIVCSECGGGGLTIPNKGQSALRNFCPNCGAKIRKAVKR